MKKIGFVDYFIDNWHSANYPTFIRQSALGHRMEVTQAWAKTDMPGKKSLDTFCKEQGIARAASLEQLIGACDYIIVLSPNNPEQHEEICDLPLRSGKPVYVDKTMAPDRATAVRLFDKAKKHNTPMFSSSALRFDSKLRRAVAGMAGQNARRVITRGGGAFSNYAVHQYEMIVATMGVGARRVNYVGTETDPAIAIDYADGRRASMNIIPGHPFQVSIGHGPATDPKTVQIETMDDFFDRFIEAMGVFFETCRPPVPAEQTIEVMALVEAGNAAVKRAGEWVDVPRG